MEGDIQQIMIYMKGKKNRSPNKLIWIWPIAQKKRSGVMTIPLKQEFKKNKHRIRIRTSSSHCVNLCFNITIFIPKTIPKIFYFLYIKNVNRCRKRTKKKDDQNTG